MTRVSISLLARYSEISLRLMSNLNNVTNRECLREKLRVLRVRVSHCFTVKYALTTRRSLPSSFSKSLVDNDQRTRVSTSRVELAPPLKFIWLFTRNRTTEALLLLQLKLIINKYYQMPRWSNWLGRIDQESRFKLWPR